MIEFHGWAKLALSSNGEQEDDIEEKLNAVKPLIKEANSIQCRIDLFPLNGFYYLSATGSLNHRSVEWQEVLNIFTFIAKNFFGSYGLLYIKDDEVIENNNSFVVYKVAKGAFTKEIDNFLSPCIPVIED